MKKAFITGHTSGAGKAILNHLQEQGWICEGYSRSNSFDISDPEVRQFIAEKSSQANLFINNAHAGFAQTQLLMDVFQQWQYEKDKCIINIGVDTVPATNWEVVYLEYPVEKVALHAAITRLHNTPHDCRIINLALGHMNTLSNQAYQGKKLELSALTETIDYILSTKEHVYIKQITLGPR